MAAGPIAMVSEHGEGPERDRPGDRFPAQASDRVQRVPIFGGPRIEHQQEGPLGQDGDSAAYR